MTNETTDFDAFARRYVEAWNEPDPGRRRERVAALWADDGHYANARFDYAGHDGVTTAVTIAHDRWVAGAGFVFRYRDDARHHHDGLRFSWEMLPAGGGEVASVGTEFVLLDSDGRIVHDHQFIEP